MRKSAVPRPAEERVAGALVAAQLGLVGALLAPAGHRPLGRGRRAAGRLIVGAGGGLALAGAVVLGPALTPSPLPAPGTELRTRGLYGRLRHPIYAGLALAAGGRALGTGARRHRSSAVALCVLFAVKARYEERWLVARFPAYTDYVSRTPALVGSRRRGR